MDTKQKQFAADVAESIRQAGRMASIFQNQPPATPAKEHTMADGTTASVRVELIPLNHIAPDPNQPRKHFDEDALATLTESVRVHGIIQPIIVRPAPRGADGTASIAPWWIIGGERRWRAASRAGLGAIPATIREDLSDADIEVLQVIENLQRADLTLAETAAGVAKLVAAIGNEHAAKQLGMSEGWVSKHARIGELHADIRDLVANGLLTSADMAHDLARLNELAAQAGTPWSFRDALDSAVKGTLTRLALREKLRWAKEAIEHEEAQARDRQAKLDAARERIEAADIGSVQVEKLSDSELREFEQSVTAKAETESESYADVIARIESEKAVRASEQAEEERQDAERERIRERLKLLSRQLIAERTGMARKLYDDLDLLLPEVEADADLFGEGGPLDELEVYEMTVDRTPIGISDELPSEWAIARDSATEPACLDECPVGIHIIVPLYRARQIVAAIAGDTSPAARRTPGLLACDQSDIRRFLGDCIDREAGADARLKGAILFDAYNTWCNRNQVKPLSGNNLAIALEAEGIERHRFKTGVHYMGCALR
jgi:ParB/RepB/Spo0J family partition protein